MFMSFDVCDSVRGVAWIGGAAWELAHNDVTASKDTRAHRAANGKGVL